MEGSCAVSLSRGGACGIPTLRWWRSENSTLASGLSHMLPHWKMNITEQGPKEDNPRVQVFSLLSWPFTVFVVVQCKSCLTLCDPWTAACQASLSITISCSLFKFMSIESVMPSNHLILCHPLLFLPSIFPSIRVFSNESALCIMWPNYWSFNINPSNEYSRLISFRIDWFDLFAVQGTLKSLLHHCNPKASILQCSTFLIVQLSHPYMTTGKTIALTIQTFVGKVLSLLFNMLFIFFLFHTPIWM